MFRLGNQIGGGVLGAGRVVRDDDHFARPGDGVDIDFAKYEPLGQRHKDIPRPDNLVDAGQSVDSIGHRRDGLRPAEPINFG